MEDTCLLVYKLEIPMFQFSNIGLPNLYVEVPDDGGLNRPSIPDKAVIDYIEKRLGQDMLKKILCEMIMKSEIRIMIDDWDCYDKESVMKNNDNPMIIQIDDLNLKNYPE